MTETKKRAKKRKWNIKKSDLKCLKVILKK